MKISGIMPDKLTKGNKMETLKEIVTNYVRENNINLEREYYLDYRDEVGTPTITKMMKSEDVMEPLYENYENFDWDCDVYFETEISEILEICETKLPDDNITEWEVYTELQELGAMVSIPYDELMRNTPCRVVLRHKTLNIDMGDVEEPPAELLELFGMTRDAWKNSTDTQPKKAILEEFENLMYDSAELVFCTHMHLSDLVDLKLTQQENPEKIITFYELNGGFVNFYNGSGSILDLVDGYIKITTKLGEWDIDIDASYHYGINSIYGISSNFWEQGSISY